MPSRKVLMPTEVCRICGHYLEDKDVVTVYIGIEPSEVDEDTEHEYWCEECYEVRDAD